MIRIYQYLASCFVFYLIASFVALDFSPASWTWLGRLLFALSCVGIFSTIFEDEIDIFLGIE